MFRRFGTVSLFVAWFCANGAVLDLVQVFAWARMFSLYSRTMSLAEAASAAMDPNKPCELCVAVRHARESSAQDMPTETGADLVKLVLICHEVQPVTLAREVEAWPEMEVMRPESWCASVPLPPPRSAGTSQLV